MCGIVGFVGQGDAEILAKMTHSIVHRGKDGDGYYIDEKKRVYLGHKRLAIIDLQDGRQPMWNREETIGIVFNGEIYNHVELRAQLIQQGHVFNTNHSDTEVLIHGYLQWGSNLLTRLNGMFAFAIYDKRKSQLFIARDRFGQKPLYYTIQKDLFAFSSELKALMQHPNYKCEINLLAMKKFMAYGYLPAPHSHHQNTYKLPGGNYLIFDIQQQRTTINSYWKFRIEPRYELLHAREEILIDELKQLFIQSVKRCSVSDVPVGVLLSGGIDSSAIAVIASQLYHNNALKTFTLGFRETSYDESPYATVVANLIRSQHYQENFSLQKCKELIPHLFKQLDEPLADSSILPTYLISKLARQQVKVVLSGDGGDELFAGYDPFKALKFAQFYSKIMPKSFHKGILKAISYFPVSKKNMSLEFKLKRALMGLSYDQKIWNPLWMSPLPPAALEQLFSEKIDIEELYSEAISLWNESISDNIFDRTLEYFTVLYLQDDILTKMDRATMMVSLESRAPFLDNDFVEFVRKLPYTMKFRQGKTKYLLKKALSDILPKSILARRKKGFGIPLSYWLNEIFPNFNPSSVHSFNQAYVAQMWTEHQNNQADHKLFLWSWLIAGNLLR